MNEHRSIGIGIGIDVGTYSASASIIRNGKLTAIRSPLDGTSIQTVALDVPDSSSLIIGRDAFVHATANPDAPVYIHMKKHFLEQFDTKIYGQYTAQDLIAELFAFIRELIIQECPDIADFPQFGGNQRPASELAIFLTLPVNCSLENRDAWIQAARMRKCFQQIDGTVQESVAAARRIFSLAGPALKNGNRVLSIDIGGGTTDISLLAVRDGTLDQVAGSTGDSYLAGETFTNAFGEHFAKELGVDWADVFDNKRGLNVSDLSGQRRGDILAVWAAAQDAKKKLSTVERTLVLVELSGGRKTVEISRSDSNEFCKPLLDELEQVIASCLDHCDYSFSDVPYVVLVGGGSLLHGLRERVAVATERNVDEILYCSDPTIVAEGAAEIAYYQAPAAQALESGFGVIGTDETGSHQRNLLFVGAKQVVPPDGLWLEKSNASLSVNGQYAAIDFRPFILKPGIVVQTTEGVDTYVPSEDISELEAVYTKFSEAFGDGNHPVRIGLQVEPSGSMSCFVTPSEMANEEPICIPIHIRKADLKHSPVGGSDVVIVMDLSNSMKGDKLRNAKESARCFVRLAIEEGSDVALIVFGYTPNGGLAEVVSDFTRNQQALESAIDEFKTGNGTFIGEALMEARLLLEKRERRQSTTVVVYSDGIPHSRSHAIEAADQIKPLCQILTVGIGDEVSESLLKRIATSPTDYFPARVPDDLVMVTRTVTDLIWADSPVLSDTE